MGEDPRLVVSRDRQAFSQAYSSYFRATRWSRLAFVVFWVVAVVFVLWALPWFNLGMSASDYSPQVITALILLGMCPAVTAIAILLRDVARQRRQALIAWLSIYDSTTGLRNEDYFLERLKLQCHMGGEMAEYRAGVVLISVDELQRDGQEISPDDRVFRLIGAAVASQMRPSDLVAAIGDREIGVLVSTAAPASLQIVTERLRHSLHHKLEDIAREYESRLVVQMGSASLDETCSDSDALLAAARDSLKVIHLDGKHISAA